MPEEWNHNFKQENMFMTTRKLFEHLQASVHASVRENPHVKTARIPK